MARMHGTKERLIDAAMHLMWADGYGAVSVDRICKAAGVNKGSFYHFFPSKEALTLATIDAIWELAESGFYMPAFDPSLHPLERINRFAELTHTYHHRRSTSDWKAEQGCPFGNVGAEVGSNDHAIRERVRAVYDAEARYFKNALTEAVAMAAIPAQDVADSASRLVALHTGLMMHAKVYNDSGWIHNFLPAAANIIRARFDGRRLAVSEARA